MTAAELVDCLTKDDIRDNAVKRRKATAEKPAADAGQAGQDAAPAH